MTTSHKIIRLFTCGTALALLTVGCASNTVIYDKRATVVPSIAIGQESRVSCIGSIEVFRDHGMFHLIGPDGPWWSHKSFYSIYFKDGPKSSTNFFLAVSPDKRPVKVVGVKGSVQIDGRHAVIDVEYQDESGLWKRLPINGRRKIDSVYPDDLSQAERETTK